MAAKRRDRKKQRPRKRAGSSLPQTPHDAPEREAPPENEPAPATATEAEGSRGPQPTGYDRLRENLEALIVAVVLAVIIRHFAVEAFEIPTGSMAPTLYGIHAWSECPNCDVEYPIALRTDSETGSVAVKYYDQLMYVGACRATPGCGMDRFFVGKDGGRLFRGGIVGCTACGGEFTPDASGEFVDELATQSFDSRCPSCHFVYRDKLKRSNRTAGHKILVTKFAYTAGHPERFDVIVFTFDQWKNYIKRLVGKPGERIDVWNGDIYVNGEIERKYRYPGVQEALWRKIADSSIAERGLRPQTHPPAWRESSAPRAGDPTGAPGLARWQPQTLRWSVNAPSDAAELEYQRGFDNFYSYNMRSGPMGGPRGYPREVSVGDKRVEFTARPLAAAGAGGAGAGASWLGAEIREGDWTFQLRLPIGEPDPERPAVLARVENDPTGDLPRGELAGGLRVTATVAISPNRPVRVAFENVDDRVAVWLDDELVLEQEYRSFPEGASFPPLPRDDDRFARPLKAPPMPSFAPSDHHGVRLLVVNGQAELFDIRVYRDMYHFGEFDLGPSRTRIRSSVQLGEDEYFAMGDNGPSSSDSRYWGHVSEDALMGKALLVFWPAWPANFQCKFIR